MGCSATKRVNPVCNGRVDGGTFHDTYELGRLLGTGAYGTVFLANRKESGKESDDEVAMNQIAVKEVAAKVVAFKDSGLTTDPSHRTVALKDFVNEQRVWTRIGHHPNIVSLLDSHVEGKLGFFVMERCHGSLLQAWKSEQQLNEYTYAKYFHDMVSAVVHIHSLGVVHRDIKHDNFLLDADANGKVKLCDFGFSSLLQDNRKLTATCGSAPFMAPEVVMPHAKSGEAADVWSVGVIVYVAFFGQWPYLPKEISQKAMIREIRSGEKMPAFRPSRKLNQGSVSGSAVDMVRAMLVRDPDLRISAADCLKTDYLFNKDTRAEEARSRGLDEVSLSRALDAAIENGVFAKSDPELLSNAASVQREETVKSLVRRSAKKRSRHSTATFLQKCRAKEVRGSESDSNGSAETVKSKYTVQPSNSSTDVEAPGNEAMTFADKVRAANELQKCLDKCLADSEENFDQDVFEFAKTVKAACKLQLKYVHDGGSGFNGIVPESAAAPAVRHPFATP